jgi:hypothetical protein
MTRVRRTLGLMLACAAALAVAACSGEPPPAASPSWPDTNLHYTPNGNFSSSGQYMPGTAGFNLADVKAYNKGGLDSLPDGVRGLVWLGDCGGVTASFRATVRAYKNDPKLFGFYIMDEPVPSTCPPAHLLAENNWIHKHIPGAVTFAILTNLGSEKEPTFAGSYTPANSGLDLVGLDPYPVRSELHHPDYVEISQYVRMAEAQGWPQSSIVPVYQTFGGGNYPDDANGYWVMPSVAQERQLLAEWAAVVPHPKFDYAYSWGSQKDDTALSQSPALRAVFTTKNK